MSMAAQVRQYLTILHPVFEGSSKVQIKLIEAEKVCPLYKRGRGPRKVGPKDKLVPKNNLDPPLKPKLEYFYNYVDDGEGEISNPFNLVSFWESLQLPYANLL